MNYLKVKDHENLVRDKDTNVIININRSEIEQAKKRKAERIKKEQEINNLKNEVSEIKSMLTKVIEKLDG
tara:strand:+ start:356 stop:565 length:210 start_codon:yes stop_codon:yes gene_type:complete